MSDLNLRYLKEYSHLLEGATAGYVNRGVITEIGRSSFWNEGRFDGYMTIEHVVTCSDHGGEKWDEFKQLLNKELLSYLRSECLIQQEDYSFCLHDELMSEPKLVLSWMGGRAKIYLMRRGTYCWVLCGYWPEVKASFNDLINAEAFKSRNQLVDAMEKGKPLNVSGNLSLISEEAI